MESRTDFQRENSLAAGRATHGSISQVEIDELDRRGALLVTALVRAAGRAQGRLMLIRPPASVQRLTHRGISRRRDPRMISGNLGAPGENEAAHLGRSCIEEGTVVRLSNMERFSELSQPRGARFYCPHAVDQAWCFCFLH